MSVVKFKSKKSNISDLVKGLVGKLENIPSERDIALAEELAELAEEYSGDFDDENMSLIFEGKDSFVIVYGSTDIDDKVYFQAVFENIRPHTFVCGEVKGSFKEALESITAKMEK